MSVQEIGTVRTKSIKRATPKTGKYVVVVDSKGKTRRYKPNQAKHLSLADGDKAFTADTKQEADTFIASLKGKPVEKAKKVKSNGKKLR